MSAKAFYHKDIPPYTPEIPPELWATIIQEATYAVGGYEPDLMTLELGIRGSSIDKGRFQQWRISLVTKRNIARVNKAWYALVSPFLYEHIILGRSRALKPLLHGMNRSANATDGQINRPIGWWTQRLDVSMRDNPNRNPQVEMDALAGILAHLPNLRILTFSITGHRYRQTLPSNVLHSLVCRDTLKIVHWHTPHFPSISSFSAFLKEYPHLESVNVNEIMNSSIPQIHLNSLNTVHVHGVGFIAGETPTLTSHIWALDLPAVRYATYEVEFSGNDELLVQGFFSAVGPQLKVIQLNQLGRGEAMEVELNLDVTYEEILQHCHALQQVNVLFNSWDTLWLFYPKFPTTVQTLVIRILRGQLSRSDMGLLFNLYFENVKAKNPDLKKVQLYSEMNIRVLQKHPSFQTCLLRMKNIGLSFLDSQGNIMEPEWS
ncbi:hypothetical protein HYPSUDRAFT_205536 [Hypholoma sublateritium FD-334 SS-4]|uniref:F-box domain-containing protein n=1 Tax=Hypholoma sublateritium (strain FD-334 SS-4) TaxID=945553 RepID=A0A0D2NH53_HYPSF|nr:hypothetical protein HYPSUDRAFT_205536 [Hypholoma sublateritium FD-334 SS-4]